MKILITKEKLEDLYIKQNKEIKEISKIMNTSISTAWRHLKYYNISKSKALKKIRRINAFKKFNKEFWDNRNKKSIQTFEKIYGKGIDNPAKIPGISEKMHKKESVEKAIITKRKNKTFNTSKDEIIIKNKLLDVFFDTISQYKSEEYPFVCDFYIPEKELYIEYQGSWTHGKDGHKIIGPYIENNKECICLLNKWKEKAKYSKFYAKAIEVWTIRDPLKRKAAKENNLNWLEFFTIDEFMSWFEKQS